LTKRKVYSNIESAADTEINIARNTVKISYNIEKLKSIIDDLGEVTGVTLAILDHNFNFLYTRERKDEGDEFCKCIHSIGDSRIDCMRSDEDMLLKCKQTKKYVSHICHAGLIDAVVPILKNGNIAGYVMVGRLRPTKEFEPNKELFSDDITLWRSRYEKLSYLSEGQLQSFVNLLSHILFENAIQIDYGEVVDKAVAYIEENISEQMTIELLSSELFVSKNKLYEGFHNYFDCTVNEYITRRRIELAKSMLASTDRTAEDIAAAVGLKNYCYFSKLFKKRVGFSPSKYRNQNKKG